MFISDQLKSRVKVNTLKFVLYLYVQQIHKVSLKASLVAGDEYPLKNNLLSGFYCVFAEYLKWQNEYLE